MCLRIIMILCYCFPIVAIADNSQTKSSESNIAAERLYIHNILVEDALTRGLDKNVEFLEKLEQFRKEQLARMALIAKVDDGMPDFTARAKEIYQVNKDTLYDLPLRLRVRILELHIADGKDEEVNSTLATIRNQVIDGQLDFQAAVMKHSQSGNLSLTQGDSYWFQQGQKSDKFFTIAASLSKDKLLSDVFIDGNKAYVLGFIDRQDAEVLSFESVKSAIIADLTTEYRENREKVVVSQLREQFKNTEEAKVNPTTELSQNKSL